MQIRLLYFLVLAGALALYIGTVSPGSGWQDCGMFQYRMLHHDIRGALGLALAHPLYHMIGIATTYIPVGDAAYRINLVSSVCGAIAVANVFLLLRLWFGTTGGAIVGAVSLAFSHTFWQHAAIAQPYGLIAAFVTTELLLVFKYIETRRKGWIYALALVNGLAISNHMFASITCAVYLGFAAYCIYKKDLRLRDIALMAGLWILGSLPYEYLIIEEYARSRNFGATVSSALFGCEFGGAVLNTKLSVRVAVENLFLFVLNCPTPTMLFFFAGVWCMRRAPHRAFAVIVSMITLLFFAFAFRYSVPDRFKFFLPFYVTAAIVLGAGFALAVPMKRQKGFAWAAVLLGIFMPIGTYLALPAVIEGVHATAKARSMLARRVIPYRDEIRYFLQPWQCGNNGPERFAREAFARAGSGSAIYADGTLVYPLLYEQQVHGIGKDVLVVSNHASVRNYDPNTIDTLLHERPVYIVTPVKGYEPKALAKYAVEQVGILWRYDPTRSRQ